MDETRPTRAIFDRDSPEFARVMAFTDGVFAIAVTLLVLDVTIPADIAADELPTALWDLRWQIFSFFLSFAVIGLYWMLHHRLTTRMRGIDRWFMRWNLVQLAFIAFLPFPTSLVGEHSDVPIAVAVYAVNVALVSAQHPWLFRTAAHRGLLDDGWPPGATRFALAARFVPVPVFLASVPVAWLSTSWARLTWVLVVPVSMVVDRFRPDDLDPDD